jgi:membrane fusion protein, macrolide-specific efflux system
VVLYDALFDVPNTTRELMTQMTAQVFFIAASARDAVFVPITALRPAGGERRAAAAKGESAMTGEAAVPKAEIAKTENTRTENVKTEIAEASKGNPDQAKGAVEQKPERRRGEGKSNAEGKAARSEGKGGAEGKAGRGEGKGGARSVDVRPGADPRTLFANGRATVRVAREDGTFEEREVRIGMMNRVSAQILDGLQSGEQVQIGGGGRGTGGPGGGKGPGAPKFAPRI